MSKNIKETVKDLISNGYKFVSFVSGNDDDFSSILQENIINIKFFNYKNNIFNFSINNNNVIFSREQFLNFLLSEKKSVLLFENMDLFSDELLELVIKEKSNLGACIFKYKKSGNIPMVMHAKTIVLM